MEPALPHAALSWHDATNELSVTGKHEVWELSEKTARLVCLVLDSKSDWSCPQEACWITVEELNGRGLSGFGAALESCLLAGYQCRQ